MDEGSDSIVNELINSLETKDLHEFIQDMLTGEEAIGLLFEPSGMFTPEELAFDTLADLPHSTRQKIKGSFKRIYVNALHGTYGEETSKEVILKIQGITAINKVGLEPDFIMDTVFDNDYQIKTKDKLRLLILLARIDTNTSTIKWLKNNIIDKEKYQFLPALIVAYDNIRKPTKGLEYLKEVPKNHKIIRDTYDFFETAVNDALINCIELRDMSKDYMVRVFYREIENISVKQLVKSIFVGEEFAMTSEIDTIDIPVKKVQDSNTLYPTKQEVSIIQSQTVLNRTGKFVAVIETFKSLSIPIDKES